jgi:hypothetical protein
MARQLKKLSMHNDNQVQFNMPCTAQQHMTVMSICTDALNYFPTADPQHCISRLLSARKGNIATNWPKPKSDGQLNWRCNAPSVTEHARMFFACGWQLVHAVLRIGSVRSRAPMHQSGNLCWALHI